MDKKIYLDYSATTPIKKEVFEEMKPFLTENYANPSSIYSIGQDVKGHINIAREKIASLINANPKEIFFTGCGTESDNWVLNSIAFMKKDKGKHIITTEFEHHAVLHTAEFLAKQGFEITYLKPDKKGIINPSDLKDAIRDDTILVSIMLANNEIGTIQDIKKMVSIAKEKGILFHTDAVQAFGNIKVDVKDLDVDFLSASAHKIYGPKGIGALYVKRGVKIIPFINGGAQENNKRAGTENVAGIVGFGKATELAKNNLDEHIKNLTELRNYFIDRVLAEIPDTYINGDREKRLPGNANITFKYIEGEAMLLMLDMKGIFISTGSACSSASLDPSHVLMSIGNPIEEIHGSVRFTVGDFTTKEDLDFTLEILKETVQKLREISSLTPLPG